MFDIGFWEIALVGVVALLVLGPERLPKVARVAGMWLGKGRRFMASVKGEIDRELKADELKRIMADQAKATELYEIKEQAQEGLANANKVLNKPLADDSPAQPPTPTASASRTAQQAASTSGADESDRKA